jgi:Tfp pilus assembly protein PilP
MAKIFMRGLEAIVIVVLACTSAMAQPSEHRLIKEMESQNLAPSPKQEPVIKRPAVQYTASNLRDPFESLLTSEILQSQNKDTTPEKINLPGMKVQGVTWGGRFPQAIINNKVLKVGDTVEGAKIVEIENNGITVLFDGKQYLIPSPSGEAAIKK